MSAESLLGRACEAKYNGIFYNGTIAGFQKDSKGNDKVLIDFYGFGKQRCAPGDVKVLIAPETSELTVGRKVEAIHTRSGNWYTATINRYDSECSKYIVKFKDYPETEILAADHLRLPQVDIEALKEQTPVETIVTPAGFELPSNLIVQEGDAEAVVAQKRKAVKVLKEQQKLQRIDDAYKREAQAWSAFQSSKDAPKKSDVALPTPSPIKSSAQTVIPVWEIKKESNTDACASSARISAPYSKKPVLVSRPVAKKVDLGFGGDSSDDDE